MWLWGREGNFIIIGANKAKHTITRKVQVNEKLKLQIHLHVHEAKQEFLKINISKYTHINTGFLSMRQSRFSQVHVKVRVKVKLQEN